jgi:hypothetical protein
MGAFDRRKQFILETMTKLDRPIWIGDLAATVPQQENYRPVLRALEYDGLIVRRPGPKGGRAYFVMKGEPKRNG